MLTLYALTVWAGADGSPPASNTVIQLTTLYNQGTSGGG